MTKHRTIGTLVRKGLKAYAGRPSERTTGYLAANLIRHLESTRLTRFSNSGLVNYRRLRRAEGASPATINREVGLLRAILRSAEVPNLPTRWGAEPEMPRSRVLSGPEARSLLDWAPEWVSDVCRLLLGTGARSGEILGALVRDVDLDTGRILVPAPKEGPAKVLVLTNGCLEAARRLLPDISKGVPYIPDETMRIRAFGRPGKTQAQDYQALRYWLRRWAQEHDAQPVTLHDLRRTFGSWAIRDGATLEQVGQTLGHTCVQTTRRNYARLDEATSRSVAERVTSSL
jgi:integrase